MSPYYAVPYEHVNLKGEKVVYIKDDVSINEWQGRLFMYKKGKRVAELINGYDGLKKYHKDNFEKWVENIRKKDLKKAEKMKFDASIIIKHADEIEDLWL